MVHLSDVVVMEVSNTVFKHKHATRNTLARNRMLAGLAKAAEQGVLLVTHDNAGLSGCGVMWEPMIVRSPSRILFCFQHDWDALTPTERALRTIRGLAEFHPDGRFGVMTRHFCGVWRCRMICLGRDFLLRQVARCR